MRLQQFTAAQEQRIREIAREEALRAIVAAELAGIHNFSLRRRAIR